MKPRATEAPRAPHRALQQLAVRMLFDPALVDRIFDAPDAALAGLGLPAEAQDWILGTDRRAWKTDPYRRDRALTALADEYPAAMALALRSGGVPGLRRFFASDHFRACVERRGAMGLAFGAWLGDTPGSTAGPLATLELAIARVRRAPDALPPPASPANDAGAEAWLALAPGTEPCDLPEGTVGWLSAIRGALARHPEGQLAGLFDPELELPAPPREHGSGEREGIIVDAGPEGPRLGFAATELVALLVEARRPTPTRALWRRARALGASTDEARSVVAELVTDGLLVPTPAGPPLRALEPPATTKRGERPSPGRRMSARGPKKPKRKR